jgi:hypothetical protein
LQSVLEPVQAVHAMQLTGRALVFVSRQEMIVVQYSAGLTSVPEMDAAILERLALMKLTRMLVAAAAHLIDPSVAPNAARREKVAVAINAAQQANVNQEISVVRPDNRFATGCAAPTDLVITLAIAVPRPATCVAQRLQIKAFAALRSMYAAQIHVAAVTTSA